MNVEKARHARTALAPYLRKTPLLRSTALSQRTGHDVFLKLETQQPTGAFKVRPAFYGILSHLEDARVRGVLTTSSGNYAQAVAYAAKVLGVHACIVMTDDTAPMKVRRTQELGAEVVFCGTTFESRFEVLEKLRLQSGAVVLHGFDSEETIAGNGTLSLELAEEFDGPLNVFSPASGGGLISGIASVLKELRPGSRVFGFQPQAGGAIVRSLEEGKRVNVGKVQTMADALVASVPGERTFEMIRRLVDGFGLVDEEEIRAAVRFLFNEQKLVVEPGGAVSVAGLLSGRFPLDVPGEKKLPVVCVVSGGNIDIQRLGELLSK